MLKEMNKDAYGGDKNVKDITLVNRDQEILMGLDNDDMAIDKESMKKVKDDNLKTIEKDEIVDIKENKTNGQILLSDKSQTKDKAGNRAEIKKDNTGAGPMGLDPN